MSHSSSSGQIAPTGNSPSSDPIVLSSKNYMVGFAVGGVIGVALGALVMHLSMKNERPAAPPT